MALSSQIGDEVEGQEGPCILAMKFGVQKKIKELRSEEERSEAMEADHQVIRKSFRAKVKHRYPLLFVSSSFVTSLLQKSHVSILFCQPKEIQRRFPLL